MRLHYAIVIVSQDACVYQQIGHSLQEVIQIRSATGRHIEQALDIYGAFDGAWRAWL
jgi:hypothetical protein